MFGAIERQGAKEQHMMFRPHSRHVALVAAGMLGLLGAGASPARDSLALGNTPEPGSKEREIAAERQSMTTAGLLSERRELSEIAKQLRIYLSKVYGVKHPAAWDTFEGMNSNLFQLSDSKITRALRGDGVTGRVVNPQTMMKFDRSYVATQSQSPNFIGSIDDLRHMVELSRNSQELLSRVTAPEFFDRVVTALSDYREAIRADCNAEVKEKFFGATLFNGSLRAGLLKSLRTNPEAALPVSLEVKAQLYKSFADLDKEQGSIGNTDLKIAVPLKNIPDELLIGHALKLGTLSTSVALTGNYFHKDSPDVGFLVVQDVHWTPSVPNPDPKAPPQKVLVHRRVLANLTAAEWSATSRRFSDQLTDLQTKTETKKENTTERRAGHTRLTAWTNDKNEVPKVLADFAAQWNDGKYPGFVAEEKTGESVTATSKDPVPLSKLFDAWAVKTNTTSVDIQSVANRNDVALAAMSAEVAQQTRTKLLNESVALDEADKLIKIVVHVARNYFTADAAQIAPPIEILSKANLESALRNPSSPGQVVATADERIRTAIMATMNLRAFAARKGAIRTDITGPFSTVIQELGQIEADELRGDRSIRPLTLRGLAVGERESKWVSDRNWSELVRRADKIDIGKPYFAGIDPNSDGLEIFDQKLGLLPGTSRSIAAIEAASILGGKTTQGYIELEYRRQQLSSSDTTVRPLVVLSDGKPLCEMAIDLRTVADTFGDKVDFFLAKGLGRLIFVDKGQRVPVPELAQERAWEDKLRLDIIGDDAWRARDYSGTPETSASFRKKSESGQRPAAVKPCTVNFDAYLELTDQAALQGALIPLGQIECNIQPLSDDRVREVLAERVRRYSDKSEAELKSAAVPTGSELLDSRHITSIALIGERIAFVRNVEGSNLDLSGSSIAKSAAEGVIADEIHGYTLRLLNALEAGAATGTNETSVSKMEGAR